jgi:L-threonylcarbamoyladenylate synthase
LDYSGEKPSILRLGGGSREDLNDFFGFELSQQLSSSQPKAPGMLTAHYSPGIDIIWEDEHPKSMPEPAKTGVLRFSEPHPSFPLKNQIVLSKKRDLREAATGLFQSLRDFSAMDVDIIIAQKFPDEGLGAAINDRLRRAAAKR